MQTHPRGEEIVHLCQQLVPDGEALRGLRGVIEPLLIEAGYGWRKL